MADRPRCLICLSGGVLDRLDACCGQHVHADCMARWFRTKGCRQCPHCRRHLDQAEHCSLDDLYLAMIAAQLGTELAGVPIVDFVTN